MAIPKLHAGREIDNIRIQNAVIDTVNRMRAGVVGNQNSDSQSFSAGEISTSLPLFPQGHLVTVKNNTASTVEAFGIMGIDDTTYGSLWTYDDSESQFYSNVLLQCVEPEENTHRGRFVILQQGLKASAFGPAWLSGIIPVQINVVDAAHDHADVKDADTTQLESDFGGSCSIIWKQAGTGTKWALVALQRVDTGEGLAKAQAGEAAGTVSVKRIKVVAGVATVLGDAFTVKTIT